MRTRGILREAWRNVSSGTTRALVGTVLLAAILIGVGLVDGLAKRDVFLAQRAYRAAGGHISTIQASGEVDAARCVALNEVPAIRGAVALRERGSLHIDVLPDNPVSRYAVAGDPVALLGGERGAEGGVALSVSLAERLGVTPGSMVSTTEGETRISQVFHYASDGRNPVLELAALTPVPPEGRFDHCWVAVWPPNQFLDGLLLSTVDTNNVDLGHLNTVLGQPQATQNLLAARPTRFIPFFGAALAALLGFALTRGRRVELALALQLGVRRRDQLLQVVLESSSWLGAALLVAEAALMTVLAGLTSGEARWLAVAGALDSAGITLAAGVGVLAGLATIATGKLYGWARDR